LKLNGRWQKFGAGMVLQKRLQKCLNDLWTGWLRSTECSTLSVLLKLGEIEETFSRFNMVEILQLLMKFEKKWKKWRVEVISTVADMKRRSDWNKAWSIEAQ
jgi:hypothetical protein